MIGDVIEGFVPNTYQIENQWEEAKTHLDLLKIPLYLVPGNHDLWNRNSYLIWRRKFGKTYYSFNYRDCHFLILNTEENFGSGQDGFGTDQLTFIKEDISQNHYKNQILIFMHQPVWLLSGKMKEEWDDIESLLDGVSYHVFAGHLHILGGKKENGKRYLMVGPTGGSMRFARNPSLGFLHHITWVTVQNDDCSVCFIEPGNIYPEELALKSYQLFLKGMKLLNKNMLIQ